MINSKGSVFIYGVMLSVVIFVLAISLAPVGKQIIDESMKASTANVIGLDCENSSISTFQKASCQVLDFSLFYFFGSLLFISGIVIGGRIIFQ